MAVHEPRGSLDRRPIHLDHDEIVPSGIESLGHAPEDARRGSALPTGSSKSSVTLDVGDPGCGLDPRVLEGAFELAAPRLLEEELHERAGVDVER